MCGILVGVESIQRLAPCLLAISFITVRMKSLPLRHSAITLASISFALSPEISKARLRSHSRKHRFLVLCDAQVAIDRLQYVEYIHLCVERCESSPRQQEVV